MSLKTEFHFPTMINIKDIPNPKGLNKYLEKRIIDWSGSDKGISKTNLGGWHSQTDMHTKEEYNPLKEKLFEMQKEIFENERLKHKAILNTMWANINYPGNSNRAHIHPNSLLSGVYYVKAAKKSGNLVLFDPRQAVQMTLPDRIESKIPPPLWREIEYEPTPGRIIIFPSWLWHEVQPNMSKDIRISISFNFLYGMN